MTAIEVELPDVSAFTVGKITVTPAGRNAIVTVFEFAILLGSADDPVVNAGRVPVIDSLTTVPGRLSESFFVGEQLAINGYNFGASGRLYINGIEARPDSWKDIQIVVKVPNQASTQRKIWVTVVNNNDEFLATGLNHKILP